MPLIFIVYVLAAKVDWIVFKDPKRGNGALVSLYLVIFFLHVIGFFISFQSFRATVRLNRDDEEILSSDDEVYTMSNSDRNVQVSDTTKAK